MRALASPFVVSVAGRRALAAVLTAVVLGGAFVSPAAGVSRSVPVRALTGSACPVEVADEATASALAASCGREVEILEERSEFQTLHALPDGQLRLDTSVSAQRSRVSGEWTDIDTSLVETTDGVAPVMPAVEMVFSDGAPGQPLVRMERDGHELTFDVPFDVGAPVVYGTTLEYRDVIEGVDLIVTVNEDGAGFSEVLRVDTPQAAMDPRIAELAFPLVVSDGLDVAEADGGFVATDENGEAVFTSPPPAMWDSRADRATPKLTPRVTGLHAAANGEVSVVNDALLANRAARLTAPLPDDHAAVMDIDLGPDAVAVTPDASLLQDPATVWPVYIDPTVRGGSLSGYISVRDDGWSDWNYAGDQGVGRCGTTGSPMYCSKVFTRRAAWQFVGLRDVGNVEPGNVTAATFSVYGTHSYNCTAYPVEAWWTGGISSGTTWSNLSWIRREQTQSVAHRPSCSNDRWIEFNVLGAGQETARYDADQLTLGLKAENESSSTGWKRYRWDAHLSITFNVAPAAPTGMQFTSPNTGCGTVAAPTYLSSRTAAVTAYFSDPDGDNVQPNMGIFNTGAESKVENLLWSARYAGVAQGTHTVSVPMPTSLVEDRQYRFQMNAVDTSVWGGRDAACEFKLDLTDPAAPTVAPEPGYPAAYVPGTESGGVGIVGAFRFASTSTDVDRYAYSFDSTSLSQSTPASSSVVTYSPPSSGEHVLRVQAVDRAGRVSGVVTYRFAVAKPQESVWLLEEGAGTTAVDSGDFGNQLPLTLSRSTSWVDGPLTDEAGEPEGEPLDQALAFDAPEDVASTQSPAVLAGQSFSVSAIVRSDGGSSAATAVSQDGTSGPAFELGQVAGPACSNGAGPCWAFQMPSSSGAGAVAAVFGGVVPAGEWVQVTGTFDAASGKATVHVCRPLWWGVPEPGGQVDASDSGLGVGPLRLGRSTVAGAPVSPWLGEIAEVRVYDAVIGFEQMQQTCGVFVP